MTFILRIFFMGLVAFVPNRDGTELTVLLVETRPGQVASNGSAIALHHPMLLARAAECRGDCGTAAGVDPHLLFPEDGAAAASYLAAALEHGAAWRLDGSDLSIVDAGAREHGPLEMQLGDIADLGRIAPGFGVVKPDLLAPRPPQNLIAARFRLRSGKVRPYRFVREDGKVLPIEFKPLQGGPVAVGAPRALADWIVAEITVPGDSIEIVESRFGGTGRRTVRLSPQDGFVELAVMNIPDPPPKESAHAAHAADTHFELYYNLARTPPPAGQRPVPHVANGRGVLLQDETLRSRLLEGLKLNGPKGFYERIICPVAQLSTGEAP
ncbi:MAG TPA: hypothetical protein VKM72_23670 [Thermoanaerobaculia bacterium]|nr:hypothetical protein [Thermoanaerobaculia bacterium]